MIYSPTIAGSAIRHIGINFSTSNPKKAEDRDITVTVTAVDASATVSIWKIPLVSSNFALCFGIRLNGDVIEKLLVPGNVKSDAPGELEPASQCSLLKSTGLFAGRIGLEQQLQRMGFADYSTIGPWQQNADEILGEMCRLAAFDTAVLAEPVSNSAFIFCSTIRVFFRVNMNAAELAPQCFVHPEAETWVSRRDSASSTSPLPERASMKDYPLTAVAWDRSPDREDGCMRCVATGDSAGNVYIFNGNALATLELVKPLR